MALTTVAFRAPSRLVALDLAHRFRAHGWVVAVDGPPPTDLSRIVRVTVPTAALPRLRAIVHATCTDVAVIDVEDAPR